MIVKICGVTRLDDAGQVAEVGADMIGLNFYEPSPRYIEPTAAREIVDAMRDHFGDECPIMVGVFVNASVSTMESVMAAADLDFVQLSGDESPAVLVELRGKGYKAVRPPNLQLAIMDATDYADTFPADERVPSLLLDAYHPKLYGGTGETASVEVALEVKGRAPRLLLAGGLNPDNVASRVAAIRPWGVDVASGVEPEGQPGIKDIEKVAAFVAAAKSVE
ncbi:MAG: phosphoribosylanthranilate isomerase [Chloroflexota bacterium]